ncbi:MAG: threonine--tRNA ligase [Methanoculleus bourgensis]|jgi:threonyl-tRNA synthetase|uniref:Threonine--tRNA ligase n=1 Tax=Methanoculleus bourgensis TaxID=83986 RepID=A0A0X3BQG7_9EURY|nr:MULTISPECIES: threonine--tRNA ligase [Methanoculleus]MDD3372765.1 threonine--tRNA ligase [Methanoculleus bourgensis]CVK34317.1 Threonine--tRNA ligase [Methanoculleus bourgensis]SAI88373.1 threonyl-tRNA synthetase [Methanoculleus bourgensis]
MRLLLIHSDHIEYEARKKTKVAEEDAVPKDALDEALAVFCAVESVDEENIEDAIRQAADEIVTTARQLGTTNIMIYPYAHLSSDLASPKAAVNVLRGLAEAITGMDGFVVKRAPFGWYKAFSLSCKGHPLSELSRTIVPGEGAAAPKKEIEHEFFVFTPEGERKDVADYVKENTPFASLIRKELGYPGPEGIEPAHVDLMRAKELVEYEPRSDVGHHRWMPRGKLIRDLLADYVLAHVLEYGGMPVETPVMYDLGDQAIAEHAAKFGERQYRFKSGNRDMMLRFAACFGMFSIMHDMHISPNTLPMKLYELSTYSFRHEQKGEVIGLKRLRAFTMPDMHTLCRDVDDALASFEEQLAIGWKSGEDLETPLVGVFRCTRDFFEQYELWIKNLVAKSGVPMLIEILSERTHYWIAKADLAAIDAQGRPIENPTVQIDVESADRFDIKYYTPEGAEVHPPILHCSPTGSIERVICALLENTATQDVPSFPTWLAPTQVRLVPVAERHICFAEEICARFNAACIRADVDDRDESVNKKIRGAGMDWVPYVAVIGDQEAETGRLTVTIRKLSEKKKPYKETMTEDELIQAVKMETAGKPFRPLYTPRNLSRKPRFI